MNDSFQSRRFSTSTRRRQTLQKYDCETVRRGPPSDRRSERTKGSRNSRGHTETDPTTTVLGPLGPHPLRPYVGSPRGGVGATHPLPPRCRDYTGSREEGNQGRPRTPTDLGPDSTGKGRTRRRAGLEGGLDAGLEGPASRLPPEDVSRPEAPR